MKRFLLIVLLLAASSSTVFADGINEYYLKRYQEAVTDYSNYKYDSAQKKFEECKASGEFDSEIIESVWIRRCKDGKEDLRRKAIAAEKARQAKLAQRRRDSLVFISVNATVSGDLFNRTKSALGETMRLNKRGKFCDNINDALTVVSVFTSVKEDGSTNGFYKAVADGYMELGNAVDEFSMGYWSVHCDAISAVNMDDAIRLVQNKLNFKLSYALDNLLNGRPQESDYYIPPQSISVYIVKDKTITEDLGYLRVAIYNAIANNHELTLSSALDVSTNQERDSLSKIEAQFVKSESRAPVHELEGFSQVLRLSVKEEEINGKKYYNFSGRIEERNGTVLASLTVRGQDYDITDLGSHSQTIAARILAAGLGLQEWRIGEMLGEYRLAYYDGLSGLLVREYHYNRPDSFHSMLEPYPQDGDVSIRHDMVKYKKVSESEAAKWRFATEAELKRMSKDYNKLSLNGTYWSRTPGDGKKTHKVVDFVTGESWSEKNSHKVACWLLVKAF